MYVPRNVSLDTRKVDERYDAIPPLGFQTGTMGKEKQKLLLSYHLVRHDSTAW